jgi:hypothetical protein
MAKSSTNLRGRLLVGVTAIVTLCAAVVGFTAAPASAATSPASITDSTGGAKTTLTFTATGGKITYTMKVCDVKADGHHAEGDFSYVLYNDDGTHGNAIPHRLKAYNYGTCTTSTGVVYGCKFVLNIFAVTMEGSTVIGTGRSLSWGEYAC